MRKPISRPKSVQRTTSTTMAWSSPSSLHHFTLFPGNSAHHFHSMQIASHQSPSNNCPPRPKQIVWQYHRVWSPKPEPLQLGPYLFTPRQLDIAAIIRACRGPEETSVTHVLEEAEAYWPHCIREAQTTPQSPTDQELTLTATREYCKVVWAIERALDPAPSSAGPQY